MRSTLLSWIIYTVTFAVFFIILFYVAAFPLRQSIVLALIIAWLSIALAHAGSKPTARFNPYWVRATPNWFQILTDYSLLGTQDEWAALQSTMSKLPDVANSEAVNGFVYTVVQHSLDGEQMLLHLDRRKGFKSKVEFVDYLRPFGLDPGLWPISLEHIAQVGAFMKWGIDDGYNLGIRVQMQWWEKMKPVCPPVLKEDRDYPCGCINLTLAILPYKEFGMYWDPIKWESGYSEKLWAGIHTARKKHQWLEKKEPDSDFARYEPKAISHKYYEVLHDSI